MRERFSLIVTGDAERAAGECVPGRSSDEQS